MAVKVEYYESHTARLAKDCLGVFTIKTSPEKIPEVSEKLKGKTASLGEDMYEAAVERRAAKVESAILECKNAAINKIRDIVGPLGVLVAYIVDEEKTEDTPENKPKGGTKV